MLQAASTFPHVQSYGILEWLCLSRVGGFKGYLVVSSK